MEKINRLLLSIATALFIVIVTVTIIGLASKKARPGKKLRTADPSPKQIESLNKTSLEKVDAYTGLGTLRVTTAADESVKNDLGVALVVTPWMTYPQGDTVFFEELSRKRLVISGIITSYFETRTERELLSLTEEKIKADLVNQINSQLSLGKIGQVYFTDYIFLE